LLVCFSNWGDASERRPFFLLDWAPMRAKELLLLSDWLNELAVFGNPKHFYDSETATHCAQALKYRHLVVLAIEPLAGNKKGDAGVRQRACFPRDGGIEHDGSRRRVS